MQKNNSQGDGGRAMTNEELKKVLGNINHQIAEFIVKISDIDGGVIFGVIDRTREESFDGKFYFYVKGYLTAGQRMYVRISEIHSIELMPLVELAYVFNAQVRLIDSPSQRVFQAE